jgi:hypothetical protein
MACECIAFSAIVAFLTHPCPSQEGNSGCCYSLSYDSIVTVSHPPAPSKGDLLLLLLELSFRLKGEIWVCYSYSLRTGQVYLSLWNYHHDQSRSLPIQINYSLSYEKDFSLWVERL